MNLSNKFYTFRIQANYTDVYIRSNLIFFTELKKKSEIEYGVSKERWILFLYCILKLNYMALQIKRNIALF